MAMDFFRVKSETEIQADSQEERIDTAKQRGRQEEMEEEQDRLR